MDHTENTKAEYESQIASINEEKEQLHQKIADSESEIQAMKDKESQLSSEVETGQADLMKELEDFKNKHSELESKVKEGESQATILQKQKFLVAALQLKCKKLI